MLTPILKKGSKNGSKNTAKKHGLAGLVILLTSLSALAAATDWNRVLNRDVPNDVKFGAMLGGVEPFEQTADELMAPASTAKLITAGAALEVLGADYRFPTTLQWRQSDQGVATHVTLVGSGDPTWGMEEFGYKLDWHLQAIAKAMLDQGIKEADDTITLGVDPRWQAIEFPAGWKIADATECGGATGQAFNLSANCASFKITSLTSGAWATPGVSAPVELRLTAGAKTSVGATLVQPTRETYGYVITGTFAKDSEPEYITLPIHDTRPWVRELFIRALKKNGIVVHAIAVENPDAQAKEQTFFSPKLSVILQPFCKNSINFIGDALLKAIGAATDFDPQHSLRSAGLANLRDFFSAAGAKPGFIINDGSGLSRSARVTPRMMFTYLKAMKERRDFKALLEALPIAGIDGTLRNRMKGTAAEGVLKAKTGTLDGVYNLAGYVPRGKAFVPFVIYSQTTVERAAITRGAIDRVGARLTAVNVEDGGAVITPADFSATRTFPFVKEHSGEKLD